MPSVALTKQEKEILRLLSAGLSNRQIAQALVIQEATVRNWLSGTTHKGSPIGIYHKLGLDKQKGSSAPRIKATLWWLKYGDSE
jgi:DNA-binding NarL/FixJ family response regulator